LTSIVLDSIKACRFLLPALHIDRLGEFTCQAEVDEALLDMTGSIQKTYISAMQRLETRSKPRRELAIAILKWLTHCKSPLQIDQLREALAVMPGSTAFDRKRMRTKKIILEVCLGLVVLESNDKTVRLVHFTLQEFLGGESKLWPDAETSLATTCLTYLLFDGHADEIFQNLETVSQHKETNPFLVYAMKHWSDHARNGDAEKLHLLTSKLFSKQPHLLPNYPGWWYWDYSKPTPHPLGYAAIHFLPGIARILLNTENARLDAQGVSQLILWSGRTKTYWTGHEQLTEIRNQLLFLAFEDKDFFQHTDTLTKTYVIQLMSWIEEPMKKRLLEIGLDINWRQATYNGETALHLATLAHDKESVEFLLAHGAKSNIRNSWGQSPNLEWLNPVLDQPLSSTGQTPLTQIVTQVEVGRFLSSD
jgi:Ankyrin repeat